MQILPEIFANCQRLPYFSPEKKLLELMQNKRFRCPCGSRAGKRLDADGGEFSARRIAAFDIGSSATPLEAMRPCGGVRQQLFRGGGR